MKLPHFCLALLVVSTTACKREHEEIKTYRVAKEAVTVPAPTADSPAGMPGGMPNAAPGADPHAGLTPEQLASGAAKAPPQSFTDTAPAHWKKQPPTPFLLVGYLVQGDGGTSAAVSFSMLHRAPGGLLANINRWRGQLGKEAIDEAALKQNSQTVKTVFGDAVVVEIEGLAPDGDATKDGRLIGAIAEQGDYAWFFKLRGNSALASAEKANFIQWIQSVKSAAPETAPAPVTPPVPSPNKSADPHAALAAPADDGSLAWQVPAGWVLAPAAGSMRYATLNITGADGAKGELAVSHFPGDVGGDLSNVNRWRQQVALPPVDEKDLAPLVSTIAAGSKTISVIDVTGPETRLAAGWVRHGADTWFFKFTGPAALVGAEKAKFTAFLESVRFTKPE